MPAHSIDQLPRAVFIEKNLGLVHACAGRFKGRGIEYEELYAAGCLGLVKACDGFDTGRGVCFSTYAVPVILGEIKKLFRDGGTVKVSRSLKSWVSRSMSSANAASSRPGANPASPSWPKRCKPRRSRSPWPSAPRCRRSR